MYIGERGERMEDTLIVTMLFDRDQTAIDQLTKKYRNYCWCIASNILSDQQDVEECLNDAYLQVWNSIPPHKPEKLSTYVGKITRNLALNRHRSNQALKRGGGNIVLVLDELSECISGDSGPEEELDRKLLSAAINDYLAQLPHWKRYIMVRRYWYADSIFDIARNCGKSENNISMALTRLRRDLRDYLAERGLCNG